MTDEDGNDCNPRKARLFACACVRAAGFPLAGVQEVHVLKAELMADDLLGYEHSVFDCNVLDRHAFIGLMFLLMNPRMRPRKNAELYMDILDSMLYSCPGVAVPEYVYKLAVAAYWSSNPMDKEQLLVLSDACEETVAYEPLHQQLRSDTLYRGCWSVDMLLQQYAVQQLRAAADRLDWSKHGS